MKKVFLVIAAMAVLATSAFAKGGDFGFFQNVTPIRTATIKSGGETGDMETPAYFGLGIGGDWWIINMRDKVDFGITLEGGFSLSNEVKLKGEKDNIGLVFGGHVLFGPSFQFNVNKRLSFTASPCFGFNFVSTYDESTYPTLNKTVKAESFLYGFGIDLGVGARFFFTEKFGMQLGINTLIPFTGSFDSKKERLNDTDLKATGDLKVGVELRIKLGLIWRFGKD